MNEAGIHLGEANTYGGTRPVVLCLPDARRHVYLVGQSGAGKSTLLLHMILQRLAQGDGLALIDPHGDLAEAVLAAYPRHRADDLVYFNPADAEFPLAFNPLARVPPERRALVAAEIVSALKSVWRDSWGPRLEYLLVNTLAALLEAENTSLLGVNRMLADEVYREWVVRQVRDPFVRAFWEDEFAQYDERFRREVIAPVQNKLGQLLVSPLLRNVVGQVRSKLDLRFAIDHHRVLIANLAKGRIGAEPANLLGALLVAQLQQAAMSRANIPEDERLDFHVLIDEFHNYTTDSLASGLAEARKYRLSYTLAHQYLDQLRPEIRSAVFGNVGTLVSFRVGFSDAEILAKEFGDAFAAKHFGDLDRFEVLVRTIADGQPVEPFRAQTTIPPKLQTRPPDKLIARSRQSYAEPRAVVEAKLARWMQH